MSTLGSTERTIGLAVILISVSAGIHCGGGGFGFLLCFVGALVGASLVAAGVRMTDGPAPIVLVPLLLGSARALAAFVRNNTANVGLVLVLASCAVMMVSGGADPLLCFAMFALLLLGVSLINVGARGA